MIRKFVVIVAVAAALGVGSAGTAAADAPPVSPLPILDHNGCFTTQLQCMVEGFLFNLVTGSADSGSSF
ncbi:hypothetical protein EV641_101450 [Rhodococcus sp. SMB37]|uniref:hypothetical protein n=1 Tax=Rhodococcus sp. SMB37 TaxID=2512213 RepID=UPI0006CFA27F|nr:hypothetical protein [Rhodococcus sp. SMB37]TCN58347.1 hypothetical protein EV641_101450 [Rhodococcus sp. SMB37]